MMKKFLAALLSLAMLLSLVACGSKQETEPPAEAGDEIALAFVFKNKTGKDLKEAYVYPTGAEDKGENILTEVWPNNTEKSQYKRIVVARPEADSYEITVVDTDGDSTVYPDLALKFMNSVSMKDDGSISVKHDAAVEFTQDDLTAAGVTCDFAKVKVDENKKVPLAFMFKNKSGKDVKEVYIYPSGITEMQGENILTKVWPHNMSEDDYLWVTIDRPDADVYDVLVNFTDGTSLLYTSEDLKNANSASMKDGEGKLSLKYDPTIGPDGKPVASASAIGDDVTAVVLRFVFKNKTGLDAQEAYVYPTGAADKGANILDGVWANNDADSDYLHPELARDRANSYEIEVKFTDGTVLTYPDLDLLNNNSVSMRDNVGGCSVKFVDGEPVASAADAAPAEASDGTATLHFTLKNKEEWGAVTSLKIVPTGTDASGAANLLTEPAKGIVDVQGTVDQADYYDIIVEFEEGGTQKLVGIPSVFDKVSLKDGGASISNEAAGVDYVTSKSGEQCKSSNFKYQ